MRVLVRQRRNMTLVIESIRPCPSPERCKEVSSTLRDSLAFTYASHIPVATAAALPPELPPADRPLITTGP